MIFYKQIYKNHNGNGAVSYTHLETLYLSGFFHMQHIHGYILQEEVQNNLATKPEGRYMFVFTPTHSSWLNLIESFFSKMTKQMLKGIRVNTKQELEDRIYKYFDEVNADPVVYHWTYKPDEISPEDVS